MKVFQVNLTVPDNRDGNEITGNTIIRTGRGISFSTNSGTPSSVANPIIRNNIITNSGTGWATPTYSNGEGKGMLINCPQATGGIISGNQIITTPSGSDPIGQGLVFTTPGAWTVSGNLIQDTHNSAIRVYGDPTLTLAYNVINDTNASPCMFFSGDDANANTTNIYNNVCYASDNGNTQLITFGANGGYAVTNHNFKNNIVYNTGTNTTALVYVSDDSTATLDYNLYYRNSAGNLIQIGASTYTQAQWANYLAAQSPQDAHSPTPADPLFISTSDFRLKGTSPAKNAGVDVSLTTDYAGKTVPFGAAGYRGV